MPELFRRQRILQHILSVAVTMRADFFFIFFLFQRIFLLRLRATYAMHPRAFGEARESGYHPLDPAAKNRYDAADRLDGLFQCLPDPLCPSSSAAYIGVEHLALVAGIGQEPLGEVLLEEERLGLPCKRHHTAAISN